jgi:hypothetical protein
LQNLRPRLSSFQIRKRLHWRSSGTAM